MKTAKQNKPCDFAQYLRDVTPLFDKAAKMEHEAYLRELRSLVSRKSPKRKWA